MIHPQLKFEEVAKNTGLEYEYWEGTEQFKNYVAKWVAWRRGDVKEDRPNYDRIRASRLDVCRKCENLIDDTCIAIKKKCGCSSASSPYKSYHAKCPLGKWQG